MEGKLILSLWKISNFDPELPIKVKEVFYNMYEDWASKGIVLKGWKVIEDSLQFFVMMKGKDEDKVRNEILKSIERIRKSCGISFKEVFTGEVKYTGPSSSEKVRIEVTLISLSKFFDLLLENFDDRKFQIPLSLSGGDVESLKEKVGRYVKEAKSHVREVEKLGKIPQESVRECILIMSILSYGEMDLEDFIDALSLIKGDGENVLNALNILLKGGLIRISDGKVRLSEEMDTIIKNVIRYAEKVNSEIYGFYTDEISKILRSIGSGIKYVVRQSGRVERFQMDRTLESLNLSKLDFSEALLTVSKVMLKLSPKDAVNSNLLTHMIVEELMKRDPSGELAYTYLYYLNTQRYICIEYEGKILPYSHKSVKTILRDEVFFIKGMKVHRSIIERLSSLIFESIRRLYAAAAIKSMYSEADLPIKVPFQLLVNIAKTFLSSTNRFYRKVLGGARLSSKEFESVLKEFIEENYKKSKEELSKAMMMFEYDKKAALETFCSMADRIMDSLLIMIKCYPSFIPKANVEILLYEVKKGSHSSLGSSFLNMVRKFLKTYSRIISLKRKGKDEKMASLLKGALRISEKLLEEIRFLN
ncbi:MAG: hypothetical protein ACTSR0_05550 [Candidatus Asgardarchaeia archaeon]